MYRCGIYLRTSKNANDDYNSIVMQEDIVNKYVKENDNIQKVKTYIDDGYSGLDFIRPGFNKLMEDIESKVIDCVVVKDLSRLGRDYIQTGMFIQYIFPSKGVRLIAINDRYDSLSASEIDKYFMIPLRNYINDAYSRDISVKVRSSLYMKMKKGECVVSKVPFGYIKQDSKYIVVEELRDIIKSIYGYCLEGYSLQGISDILNEQNVVTPYQYRYLAKDGYTTSFVDKKNNRLEFCWYPMMVKRILTDRVYIGALVQGKVEKYSYKIKKRHYKEENMWYLKYNHHKKIIEEKVFWVVSYILNLDVRRKKNEIRCSDYSGIVRCGMCNESLYNKQGRYVCRECKGRFYDVGNIIRESHRKNGIGTVLLNDIIGRMIFLLGKEIECVEYMRSNRSRIVMNIRNIHIYNSYIKVGIYCE